jgi:imidazolonepropionase-like amidohydrolase
MISKLAASAALATVMTGTAMAETTLIHAGHVLAEPGEGYLTRQTITVEDGEIVSIEAGYKRAPRDADLIDLKDAYVLPGLIDSHVHITFENGPNDRIKAFEDTDVDAAFDGAGFAYKTLLTGFTTVQDVGSSNNAIFGLRDAIAKGNVPGPRIRASGQGISVTGGHGDINGYSPEVMMSWSRLSRPRIRWAGR